MTKEGAYCCLNCKASANCCGACGECPACCEDCGDTSSCTTTAYFDGSNFYKHYIYTATASSSYAFADGDGSHAGNYGGYENYTSTYDTSKEIPCSKNGSALVQDDSAYFDDNYYSYNGATTTSTLDYEDCDDCPRTATGPSSCVNGDPIVETSCDTVEDCFPHCEYCGPACCEPFADCGYCENPTIYRAFARYKTKITFKNPVKLYNSLGEDVGNIIGANYNSNNPITSWSAPGCHFFHP